MTSGIYVEVVDLDGLAHHIGPFKDRSNARNWIAQNSLDGIRRQGPTWTANGPQLYALPDALIQD